jgi:hypothetical protein
MTFPKPSLTRLLLAFTVTGSTWAWSQQADSPQQRGPWVKSLAGGTVQQLETDLDSGDGSVSVSRFFIQPSLGYAWDRRTSVSLSLGAGLSDYDFSNGANVGGTKPWGTIHDFSVSLPIRFAPMEPATVFAIPSVRSYVEEGASLNDGRTEGIIAAAGWKFSDSLTLGPGFGWFSELGGGTNAFPIILVDWKITDRLSLTTGRGLAASQGPGLTLNYKFDDNWQMGLTGRSEKTRFALDGDAALPEGFGEDKSLPLLLTLSYSPWPRTSITALAGAEFEGSLRKEDGRGKVIARSDLETAAVFGLVFSSQL